MTDQKNYPMPALTQSELKKILTYDPETGFFTRNSSSGGRVVGSLMGSINSEGYRLISIRGRSMKAGRLAFLYMTGSEPEEIDHENRIRSDDRWVNLRDASHGQNGCNKKLQRNNKSGVKCVNLDDRAKSWAVNINLNGRRVYVGRYKDFELAELVAASAREKYYGDFATSSVDKEVKDAE